MGDEVAQVQDHVVVAVQEHLGHRSTDGVVDAVELRLGLLGVQPLAGGVGHLARALVKRLHRSPADSAADWRGARQLRRDGHRALHAHSAVERIQATLVARPLDVLERDPLAVGDHHGAVSVRDVRGGPPADETTVRVLRDRIVGMRRRVSPTRRRPSCR